MVARCYIGAQCIGIESEYVGAHCIGIGSEYIGATDTGIGSGYIGGNHIETGSSYIGGTHIEIGSGYIGGTHIGGTDGKKKEKKWGLFVEYCGDKKKKKMERYFVIKNDAPNAVIMCLISVMCVVYII